MPFEFTPLEIPEVLLIAPRLFPDERGAFAETYKHSDFTRAGIPEHFVQDNYSTSLKNVLRGLHYQLAPQSQGKLVRCLRGRIFDVAVDLRRGSPSFGRWVGRELSGDNGLMLYVPPAFAHGFAVLSDRADVLYKCTAEYAPEADRGILWNDPDINISWPLGAPPLLSPKDSALPLLRDAELNFSYGREGR